MLKTNSTRTQWKHYKSTFVTTFAFTWHPSWGLGGSAIMVYFSSFVALCRDPVSQKLVICSCVAIFFTFICRWSCGMKEFLLFFCLGVSLVVSGVSMLSVSGIICNNWYLLFVASEGDSNIVSAIWVVSCVSDIIVGSSFSVGGLSDVVSGVRFDLDSDVIVLFCSGIGG